jgi:hypothetical protein
MTPTCEDSETMTQEDKENYGVAVPECIKKGTNFCEFEESWAYKQYKLQFEPVEEILPPIINKKIEEEFEKTSKRLRDFLATFGAIDEA